MNKTIELCTNENCRTFTKKVNHDYCPKCRRTVKDIQRRFYHEKTKEKPSFETALGIAWRALRIFSSPYSAPEQLEWACHAYPEGMAEVYI